MCRAGVSTAGLYVFAEDVDFKNIGFDSSRALNLLVGQTPDKLYLQRIRQWKRRVLKHPHLGTWRKPIPLWSMTLYMRPATLPCVALLEGGKMPRVERVSRGLFPGVSISFEEAAGRVALVVLEGGRDSTA